MAKHEMPAAKHEAPAAKRVKAPGAKAPRTRKAISITLAILLLLGAAGGGGYYYLQHRTGKAVNVYPAQQLGTSDSWYDRVNTGGQVRADKMQTVYLSSTQTVTEVFVSEGQQVQAGDPLLAFDTTLDEVELTRKQIAIDQLNLEIEKAQKTLKEIDTYKVGSPGGYSEPDETATPAPTAEPESTGVPYFQGGQGTAEDPYVFLWDENASLIDGTVDYLLDMATGVGVPEVTTGPDVPLDPDQTPPEGGLPEEQLPEDQQPDAGADPGQLPDMAVEPAGDPVPIGAGQSHSITKLLSPGRLLSALSALRDPAPAALSFGAMTAEDILRSFQDLEADPEALASYYASLTPADWEAIAGVLTAAGQLETLRTLLTGAGLADPFPPADPATDPPSDPSSGEPSDPPSDTPSDAPSNPPVDAPSDPPSDTPSDPPSDPPALYDFANMGADAILALFQQHVQAGDLADFCAGLSPADWQTIAGVLTAAGQLETLRSLLTGAGIQDPLPTEPPEDPPTDAPVTDAPVTDAPVTDQPTEPTPSPTPEPTPTPTPMPVGLTYYMVFEVRANNSMQGEILRAFELEFTLQELEWQRYWAYRVLDPVYMPQMDMLPDFDFDMDLSGGFGGFDSGVYYSAAEIAQMRAETQREIASKTIELKMAQQDLKQVQYELSNGQVLATTAGVVKSVLDPDEALQNNEPVVKVSGGGGYFITPYMSEFDMQDLHVGDTVTVENYMAGETLEGTITEISRFPSSTERYVDYYSNNTNNNVSKYPFTVEVGEDANMRDGDYVNVYFSTGGKQAEQDSDAYYLENAFLRTEGGRSYVYAAGPDGLLEKRFVTTGRNLYGSMTEITGGLDPETDYLAFPYGRSVKPGAPTVQQEDIMVLINGY